VAPVPAPKSKLNLGKLANTPGKKAALGGVVLVGGYLLYKRYEANKAASAASSTAAGTTAATTTPDTSAGTGGYSGGYGGGGGGGTGGGLSSQIAALTSAIQGLQPTSTSSTGSLGPDPNMPVTPQSGGTSTTSTTGTSGDTSTTASTGTAPIYASNTPISGANLTPAQATQASGSGQLTPEAALASETPASQETAAQRHAQEVANRSLRVAKQTT
jgi:hypothetical protein